MNKLLRLESVTSAVPQITWGSLRFCILQAIKNWRRRRPGNEARKSLGTRLRPHGGAPRSEVRNRDRAHKINTIHHSNNNSYIFTDSNHLNNNKGMVKRSQTPELRIYYNKIKTLTSDLHNFYDWGPNSMGCPFVSKCIFQQMCSKEQVFTKYQWNNDGFYSSKTFTATRSLQGSNPICTLTPPLYILGVCHS